MSNDVPIKNVMVRSLKSGPFLKTSSEDIAGTKYVRNEHDFSHALNPEHQRQGLKLTVHHEQMHSPEGHKFDKLSAEVHDAAGKQVGSMEAPIHHPHQNPEEITNSVVEPYAAKTKVKYKGQGLSRAMHEAILTHATKGLGIEHTWDPQGNTKLQKAMKNKNDLIKGAPEVAMGMERPGPKLGKPKLPGMTPAQPSISPESASSIHEAKQLHAAKMAPPTPPVAPALAPIAHRSPVLRRKTQTAERGVNPAAVQVRMRTAGTAERKPGGMSFIRGLMSKFHGAVSKLGGAQPAMAMSERKST